MRDAEEVAREAYAAAEKTYDALREFGPKMSPGEVRERMIYAMAEVIRARDAAVAAKALRDAAEVAEVIKVHAGGGNLVTSVRALTADDLRARADRIEASLFA